MIDKQPVVILRCTSTADVVAAVAFARRHGLPVAVRGGGHGVAGNALADDAAVVDLSEMKAVGVDPEARIARAEPGVTLGELVRATQAFGLATPLGVVSQTGIAGLTLGGGIGRLRRKHGLAAGNLVSLEVVTADGRIVTASEAENADLFWGLLGGGGGLGIVTSFETASTRSGTRSCCCSSSPPASARARSSAGSTCSSRRRPRSSAWTPSSAACHTSRLPEEAHGRPYVASLAPYIGSVQEGERVVAPLRELGEPIADFSAPTTYLEAQAVLDADYPDGGRFYWKSANLERLDADVIDRLTASAAAAPSDESTIDIWFQGGAIAAWRRVRPPSAPGLPT